MAMPRGGRPLVTAKRMFAWRRSRTASTAPGVSTFSEVTSVPSTSASISRIGGGVTAPSFPGRTGPVPVPGPATVAVSGRV